MPALQRSEVRNRYYSLKHKVVCEQVSENTNPGVGNVGGKRLIPNGELMFLRRWTLRYVWKAVACQSWPCGMTLHEGWRVWGCGGQEQSGSRWKGGLKSDHTEPQTKLSLTTVIPGGQENTLQVPRQRLRAHCSHSTPPKLKGPLHKPKEHACVCKPTSYHPAHGAGSYRRHVSLRPHPVWPLGAGQWHHDIQC